MMEGHSDRSSSLSADSGGLIDLCALDSDCKIGDSSQASVGSTDKSKEVNGNPVDKRRRQPSGEAWLADMDTRMKDMKLIEEEEFDFDIPDDYLNISMEPEQPSSTEEESLSSDVPSPDQQGTRGLLVEVEEGKMVSHDVQGRGKMCFGSNKCLIEVGNLGLLCAGQGEDPCVHGGLMVGVNGSLADIGVSQLLTFEEVSQNGSVSAVELLPMGCCDTTWIVSTSKRDLIAFTPAPQDWETSQEGFDCVSALRYNPGETCRNVSSVQAYVCQEQLAVSEEEQLGSLDVPGQIVEEQSGQVEVSGQEQVGSLDVPGQMVEEQLGHPEDSGQMVEEHLGQDEVSGEEQLGSIDISGQVVSEQPEALGQVEQGKCESSSKSEEFEGRCGGEGSVGELQRRSSDSAVPLNRSRLPTPSNQLKRCSTFSRSPVKCVQLEELREASKQLIDHPLLPQACPSVLQSTDITAALSSLPHDSSAIRRSSSCETFVVPSSSSGSSPTTEVGRESLDDSRSSCLSQASQVSNASSTTSRSSRESSIGCHGGGVSKLPRKPGRVRGIPRASSQSKLTKPGSSKPSLLPSKPVTAMSMGAKKLPEKPLAKPTVLTRDAQGSHSTLRLKLPLGGAGGSASSVSGGGDGVQAGATNFTKLIPRQPRNIDKGSRLTIAHPMRATCLVKPATSTGKLPAYNSNKLLTSRATQQHHGAGTSAGRSTAGGMAVPKSKLTSPAPRRRNSTCTATVRPATAVTLAQRPSAVPASTLSTSIVSTGSPSVQHSTPVKETPSQKLVDRTPKRSLIQSTPDRVRPRFSFSSIESITPNPAPGSCPHANETYDMGSGDGATKTPKSSKKGRRSLIPTPGGQERGCSHRVGSPLPFSFGGESTFSVPAGRQEPLLVNGSSPPLKNKGLGAEDRSKGSTNMPPPKAKRVLKPGMRPSGLQRPVQRMGTRVLGVRPNGSTSAKEPMKAKSTFAFGGYDEDSEVPVPSARVIHSPLDKENRLATPHSKWSPIRRKRLTADEESIQCTKRIAARHNN